MKIKNPFSIWFFISVFIHLAIFVSFQVVTFFRLPPVYPKPIEIVVQTPKVRYIKRVLRKIVEQDNKPINNKPTPNAAFFSQYNQNIAKQTQAQASGKFNNSAGKGLSQATQSQEITNHENSGGDGKEVSRNNNYLKEIERGKQTLLSTKAFVEYSYLKKIRQRIEEYWAPAIKPKFQKVLDGNRGTASIDRETKLLIVIDSEGNLVRVQKIDVTGIQDLDDTAVEAFKVAAPFPPPPPNLLDKEGFVKLRWDFVLEEQ